jgi:hypothetical protein
VEHLQRFAEQHDISVTGMSRIYWGGLNGKLLNHNVDTRDARGGAPYDEIWEKYYDFLWGKTGMPPGDANTLAKAIQECTEDGRESREKAEKKGKEEGKVVILADGTKEVWKIGENGVSRLDASALTHVSC